MRVVVTGAAGFIGSRLAEVLLDRGCEVVGIDALTPDYDPAEKRRNLAPLLARPGFRLVRLDLARTDPGPHLAGAALVVHLAATAGVRSSWGRAFPRYLRNNVLATQRLLEAAAALPGLRVALASSSSVYGGADDRPAREDDPPGPRSPYAVSKLAAEQLCRAYADERGVPCVILRYFTVYGPRQRPDMAVRRFLEAVRDGRPVVVFGGLERRRDLTYVDDAVAATAALLDAFPAGTTLNVASGRPVTLGELLAVVAEVTGRQPEIRVRPAPAGDVETTWGDVGRARRLLGWQPATGLRDGLAATWAWLCGPGAVGG